jgi:hypothetical protein
MRRYSPPAFVCWLVGSVLPTPYREAMLGDLIEEFTLASNLRRYPLRLAGFGVKAVVLCRPWSGRRCEPEIGSSV